MGENGGFSPAALSVPQGGQTTILPQTYPNTAMADHQQVNFQPIRTIQPVRSRIAKISKILLKRLRES